MSFLLDTATNNETLFFQVNSDKSTCKSPSNLWFLESAHMELRGTNIAQTKTNTILKLKLKASEGENNE